MRILQILRFSGHCHLCRHIHQLQRERLKVSEFSFLKLFAQLILDCFPAVPVKDRCHDIFIYICSVLNAVINFYVVSAVHSFSKMMLSSLPFRVFVQRHCLSKFSRVTSDIFCHVSYIRLHIIKSSSRRSQHVGVSDPCPAARH